MILESEEERHRKRTRDRTQKGERVRTRIKAGKSLPPNALRGIVVSAAGPYWVVAPAPADPRAGSATVASEHLVLCMVSGTVDAPEVSTLVTVGDVVWYIVDTVASESEPATGSIVKVEERTTLLSRKAAGRARKEQVLVANVEQLAIVIAAAQPDYHRRLIDRYLIAADKGDLRPLIIVNKLDLVGGKLLEVILDDLRVYHETLNLDVYFVSTVTGQGLEELARGLSGTSTLFAGQSGVGKSSIINKLASTRLKVGEISELHNKGKHTTTGATVIPLDGGGTVVDSAGIREFAIWELDQQELPYYFEEFAPFAPACKFTMCTHTHEPGCAVKQAVDDGQIEEGRYISYTVLFDEIGQQP